MIELLNLFKKEIDDEFTQENFKRLWEFINYHPLFKGSFKFFEFTFDSAVTNKQLTHKLPFAPKDVITLNVSNGATVTWNYDLFNSEFLVVTTSGACTVRAYVGRYAE